LLQYFPALQRTLPDKTLTNSKLCCFCVNKTVRDLLCYSPCALVPSLAALDTGHHHLPTAPARQLHLHGVPRAVVSGSPPHLGPTGRTGWRHRVCLGSCTVLSRASRSWTMPRLRRGGGRHDSGGASGGNAAGESCHIPAGTQSIEITTACGVFLCHRRRR
jgi:hypothetical protein